MIKEKTLKSKKLTQLDFIHAQQLIQKQGIPTCPTTAIRNAAQFKAAQKIPFPWAMKAIGKKLLHKTDVGGLKLNIQNENEARDIFKRMKKIPGCEYVIVQPMRKGIELIVGGKMDPQFGPTVLLGMGGIYTEIFKDSSVRVAPLGKNDIEEMIHELKIYPILQGARGQKGINFNELKKIVRVVSQLMSSGKISELDLNPVMATPENVEAVDVRIIN